MKISVLSSGSKGNCTLVHAKNTKILIDLGVAKSYVEKNLEEINVDPDSINAILITHTHIDHIQGLKVFLKKYKPKLYVNEILFSLLKEYITDFDYEIYSDNHFTIGDFNIDVLNTSHDSNGSVGFIIRNNNKSAVYITDTGYINNKYHNCLCNHDIYILESNHDVTMLMEGNYPFELKKRILGNKGHLSNEDAAYYLSMFVGNNTKTIILAHLSDDNNTHECAYDTVYNVLKSKNKDVENIIVAKQKQRTELIEV